MPAKKPLKERFEAKFIKGEPDQCWEWTAGLNPQTGYGQIMTGDAKVGFRPDTAQRVSYKLYIGEIPEGLVVDHKCRNRKCVNPNHLQLLTNMENLLKDNDNAHKTHCQNGHEFTEENTYINKESGARQCKICRKALQIKFRLENPDYKKKYWSAKIEENRQKQRDYLTRKTGKPVMPRS